MSACVDCGAKRGGPLCTACTKTAASLGHTAEERLAMLGWAPTGFQMQSHHKGVWTPMEDGAASKHWAPTKTAYEAVKHCLTWTGLICIPAMRVIDLATGEVVWQDRYHAGHIEDDDESVLDRIIPSWAEPIYRQVAAANRRDYEASLCPECRMPCGSVACRKNHDGGIPPKRPVVAAAPVDDGALFSLAEVTA